MIPGAIITEWRAHSPWTSAAHVEQDLIIARALVELYSSPEFSAHMLFRGGTALHKLVLHPSARYSNRIRSDPDQQRNTQSHRGKPERNFGRLLRTSTRRDQAAKRSCAHITRACSQEEVPTLNRSHSAAIRMNFNPFNEAAS